MTTTTNYLIHVSDENPQPFTPTASADDIHSALNAAWELNRHTECAVEIVDNRDATPRVVARVSVEWLDGC